MFGGRCKVHVRWPAANPERLSGWETSKIKRALIAVRGERCEVPGCQSTGPIELHHLNGVTDNRPEALELRCRRHNPRGAPTRKQG